MTDISSPYCLRCGGRREVFYGADPAMCVEYDDDTDYLICVDCNDAISLGRRGARYPTGSLGMAQAGHGGVSWVASLHRGGQR